MKPQKTFTKKFVTIIMAIALIDIQFPFVLAFLGREQIAESMGQIIVTEIIGVFFVYCVKSFFETKEEKKNEMMIYEKRANRNGDITGFDDAEVNDINTDLDYDFKLDEGADNETTS